jgi:hypothetical protein
VLQYARMICVDGEMPRGLVSAWHGGCPPAFHAVLLCAKVGPRWRNGGADWVRVECLACAVLHPFERELMSVHGDIEGSRRDGRFGEAIHGVN